MNTKTWNNKQNKLDINLALAYLNTLIDLGYEFPIATSKTLDLFTVNQDELTRMYDDQQ